MFAPPDQAADRVSGKMQRIAVSFPRELVARIDDFGFASRLESRGEAIQRPERQDRRCGALHQRGPPVGG